jgi:uncharacterized iron-regulated membrane protein
LYRRVWHWHFYAGLICLPFIFLLALTGAAYLFHQQIDDVVYRRLLLREPGAQPALPPTQLIAAAVRAEPGDAKAITLPDDAAHTAQVDVTQADGNVRQVFVDPASGQVHGAIDESARVMTFVKHLHSLTVLGTGGRMMIETVAGWIIVLMLTGAYLWWPRGRRHGVTSIRPGAKGRAWWRDLHAVTGAFGGIIILFLALTGMPWSVVWGQQVNRWLSEHDLGRPKGMWNNLPHSTVPAAALGDLPWTLQQQPLPASDDPHAEHNGGGGHAHHHHHHGPAVPAGVARIDADQAARTLAAAGMRQGYRLVLPQDAQAVYSAIRTPGQLDGQRVIHLDQYSGKVLMDLGADRIGAIGRMTEWGVSVHQGGEYGWPNQLVMLLGCVALMLLCVSGVVVWWKRRPSGHFAPPPRRDGDRLALGAIVIAAVTGLLFPLLGASMLLAALINFRFQS